MVNIRSKTTGPPPVPLRETRFPPGPLLRAISELDDRGLRPDHAQRVESARVVFANHEILQHDFPALTNAALLRGEPSLRELPDAAREEALRRVREQWLLAHAGIISVTQAGQTIANTRILVEGEVRKVWRPSRYGRALVAPVGAPHVIDGGQSGGLIDIKGAGVAEGCEASLQIHSSGLCYLGEVLREFLFQSLIDEIFRRAATRFWTLPVYGIIDLGFDARSLGGKSLPAGLLVRRAHRRPVGGMELPVKFSQEEQTQVEIELLLRHYGLTSSNRGTRFRFEEGASGLQAFYAGNALTELSDDERRVIRGWLRDAALPLECDGINIQMTRGVEASRRVRAQLVDFGHFEMRSRFSDPLVSLVCNQLLRWSVAVWPHDPAFVQPSPALCVPETKWGFGRRSSNGTVRPRRSKGEGPFVFAHNLARNFRAGQLNGKQVQDELAQFISDSITGW